MSAALAWFARHEARLAWRDALWWLKGKRHATTKAALVATALTVGLHVVASLAVGPLLRAPSPPDVPTLLLVTGAIATAFMLMLSQAMESVTRVLYARGDIDLILSSPAPARAVFALRLAAIAAGSTAMAVLVMGPFVNVLAWHGGAPWLWGYAVLIAMGLGASALAILATLALFKSLGPKRTRLVAQIVAAVVGAAIVIGLQIAAILGHQGLERFAPLRDTALIAAAPGVESPLWWVARGAMGDGAAALALLLGAITAAGLTIASVSGGFAAHVVAVSSVSRQAVRGQEPAFVARGPAAALRRKELVLLTRDPWLLSQTLMQILYLIPPALLLWQGFGENTDPAPLIVPVLVMAAGQLAGGLAWLAISGEDAPELIATAPVTPGLVLRSKVEAVLIGVAVPMAPFLAGLALLSPVAALVGAAGVLCATAASTAIQFFFRTTAKRSAFRRRQTASRAATFSEAFSSIAWAGAAALAAAGSVLALAPALVALAVLGFARLMAPR